MNISSEASPNSLTALQQRMLAGQVTWVGPALMVFARFVLAILAQALVAGVYALRQHPMPWQAAAPWWTVYGTLIDLACLVVLSWLTRREGIRLFDLVGFQRSQLRRDLWLSLAFFLLFLLLGFSGGTIAGLLIYGTQGPNPMGGLPAWAAVYSVLVWPILWGLAEQMTYQGYALPRLEALSGRAWLAVLVTGFGWALQHVALPLMIDWRFMLYRFVSTLPFVVILLFYLRLRRLLPFIIAHWAVDAVSALLGTVLPLIAK